MMDYPLTADLAYWINERESMRLRREAGVAAPWSVDPTMASVRYCNVHREDDKITRYIRQSSIYSGADIPTWHVVLARMVNRIASLDAISDAVRAGDLEEVRAVLKDRRKYGRIWGNAYTISTCGKVMDKVDYVIDGPVADVGRLERSNLWRDMWASPTDLNFVHRWLMEVDGLGSFLAAQVVADLKNTPEHPLATAEDWWTWAAPGPGSLAGLTAFWGTPATPGNFTQRLQATTALVTPLLASYVAPIGAQDMQNCLCEFSKYQRVRLGGRARNIYPPTDRIQHDPRYQG